jgi:hypothetical protein
MKNLLLIILIVTVLLAAGCTGEKQNPVAAPTQNPVVTPAQNPTVIHTRNTVVPPTPQVVYATATVLVIPTAVPAQTGIPDQGSYQTYKDKEFNFAIQIPKSWTADGEYVTAAGVKKYKVIFDDPTQTSSQYITITPGSTGLSPEDWVNVFLIQMKADPSVGIVGQYPLQLDGTPAKKLVLTTGSGNDVFESTIIMAVKGDNSYFMEFESRKDDYPGYSQDADRMISTFTFT